MAVEQIFGLSVLLGEDREKVLDDGRKVNVKHGVSLMKGQNSVKLTSREARGLKKFLSESPDFQEFCKKYPDVSKYE